VAYLGHLSVAQRKQGPVRIALHRPDCDRVQVMQREA
jgi:hypothetical protein